MKIFYKHAHQFALLFLQLAMKAVPYYEDFIKALGKGKVEEQTVLEEMKHFVTELAANLDNIIDFYQKTNQEVDKKV